MLGVHVGNHGIPEFVGVPGTAVVGEYAAEDAAAAALPPDAVAHGSGDLGAALVATGGERAVGGDKVGREADALAKGVGRQAREAGLGEVGVLQPVAGDLGLVFQLGAYDDAAGAHVAAPFEADAVVVASRGRQAGQGGRGRKGLAQTRDPGGGGVVGERRIVERWGGGGRGNRPDGGDVWQGHRGRLDEGRDNRHGLGLDLGRGGVVMVMVMVVVVVVVVLGVLGGLVGPFRAHGRGGGGSGRLWRARGRGRAAGRGGGREGDAVGLGQRREDGAAVGKHGEGNAVGGGRRRRGWRRERVGGGGIQLVSEVEPLDQALALAIDQIAGQALKVDDAGDGGVGALPAGGAVGSDGSGSQAGRAEGVGDGATDGRHVGQEDVERGVGGGGQAAEDGVGDRSRQLGALRRRALGGGTGGRRGD